MILRIGVFDGLCARNRILGFDVPVHDPQHVRFGERVAGLEHVVHGPRDGERAALEQAPEVLAHQVLHDHVGAALEEASHVVNTNHVVGCDLRREAAFAHETLHERRVLERLRFQVLDGHALIEREVPRDHDDADAAFGDRLLDEVFARDEGAVGETRRGGTFSCRRGCERRREGWLAGRVTQDAPYAPRT